MPLSIVVLAAGHGVRMQSEVPKILHPLAGRPFIRRVIETAQALSPDQLILVHGRHRPLLEAVLPFEGLQWANQAMPLGTGDAVRCAFPLIHPRNRVLVLLGDVPLISAKTLQRFLDETPENALGLMTVENPKPKGLGRILRDAQGTLIGIVEEKDATPAQRLITEVNTGMFLVPGEFLGRCVPQFTKNNQQGEFYLTELVPMARKEGLRLFISHPDDPIETQGVNDKCELAALERAYQRKRAEEWLRQGVCIADPARFDVRGTLTIAPDVSIDINVIFEGTVRIGRGARIGASCCIKDCDIGENTEILPFSHLDGAVIGADCRIGPFARIRPNTVLAEDVRVGNFVEVKESAIDAHTRMGHLSYVGNATIGAGVNIGAGTITCNYDGVHKHHTTVEAGAFIGSGSQLVAPITVGHHATIGAGTVLTSGAPPEKLTLRRAQQRTIDSWQRPQHIESEKE